MFGIWNALPRLRHVSLRTNCSVCLLSGLPHDGCPCCHDTHLVPAARNVPILGGSLVVPTQSGILNKSDHEKDASFKQFETLSPGLKKCHSS